MEKEKESTYGMKGSNFNATCIRLEISQGHFVHGQSFMALISVQSFIKRWNWIDWGVRVH